MLGVVALVAASLSAGAAFAVHDDGKFELDKNASNNTNVTPVGYLDGQHHGDGDLDQRLPDGTHRRRHPGQRTTRSSSAPSG